jgi:hypothetical protein
MIVTIAATARREEMTLMVFRCFMAMIVAAVACASGVAAQERMTPVDVTIGRSVTTLTGPWKFRVGDDARWARPDYDDSSWETVDLTAPPGAHDGDVGLSGYVPGWGAKGHRGYVGYAWYRLHLSLHAPADMALSLAGPPSVDDAYQIFLNGDLLGGSGDFTHAPPVAHSAQPHLFAVPTEVSGGGTLLAFRVWMGPWSLSDPSAGGIHIAPQLGERREVGAHYKLQWLETFDGYIVEVVEALVFLLLALMGLSLRLFDQGDRAYSWFAAALGLTALHRANQAFFYWGQLETVHEFELLIVVLVIPTMMGTWLLAWHAWFASSRRIWLPRAVAAFTIAYMAAEFLSASWFQGLLPRGLVAACAAIVVAIRLIFLLLLAVVVYDGVHDGGREAWYAVPAVIAIGTGLFARELSYVHVRGIWFPFGTGVSRTQFAYAVFDVLLAGLFMRRLWEYAQRSSSRMRPAPPAARIAPTLHDGQRV